MKAIYFLSVFPIISCVLVHDSTQSFFLSSTNLNHRLN